MKNIKRILVLLFVGLSIVSYAQQFQLVNKEGISYTDGEKISLSITENDLDVLGDFITEIFVKNLTDMELDVRTSRTNLNLVEGMNAYVCFGICDDPEGTMLAMNCLISENDSASYALHLRPNEKLGLCEFQIDFMVPGESMTLFVEINVTPLSIKESGNATVSLAAYPNPASASSTIHVSYTLANKNNTHHLKIRNIMGATVINLPLNPYENSITFDAAALKPGVYFYTIDNNNQTIAAKKLIVK